METRQELCQCRLAASGLSHQRDQLARGNRQGYAPQHGPRFVPIAEMNITKFDLPLQWRQLDRVRLLADLGVFVHHFPDVLRGGQRLRKGIMQTGELSHWVITASQQKKEGEKLRGVYPAESDFAFAKEEQGNYEENSNQLDDRRGHSGYARRSQIGAANAFGHRGKTISLAAFTAVCLDDALIGQRFLGGVG